MVSLHDATRTTPPRLPCTMAAPSYTCVASFFWPRSPLLRACFLWNCRREKGGEPGGKGKHQQRQATKGSRLQGRHKKPCLRWATPALCMPRHPCRPAAPAHTHTSTRQRAPTTSPTLAPCTLAAQAWTSFPQCPGHPSAADRPRPNPAAPRRRYLPMQRPPRHRPCRPPLLLTARQPGRPRPPAAAPRPLKREPLRPRPPLPLHHHRRRRCCWGSPSAAQPGLERQVRARVLRAHATALPCLPAPVPPGRPPAAPCSTVSSRPHSP